jgi:GTP-binding protein HflX
LILHVFASRARTREAQIQVELAQMEYLLPRLTRRWTHLSRQAGASGSLGLKGVGETQLELDRRQIRRKISRLKRDLSRVEQGRAVRRAGRSGLFTVALVGYTNAGKSTLFNALGGRQVARVEDRLFATLDPTVRRCRTSRGDVYLLIDTVGFLRKLPIDLVASFRSTLEEAGAAHLILHVVDISHPRYEDHMTTTTGVLADLGLLERPTQVVFNKVDLLRARGEEGVEERAAQLHPGAIMASARETEGVPAVREAIGRALGSGLVTIEVAVPVQRVDLVEKIHAAARVLSEAPEGEENRRLRITLQAGREGIVRILAMSGVEEVVA